MRREKKVYVQGKACQAQNKGSSWELVQCSYDRLQFFIGVGRYNASTQAGDTREQELLLVSRENARHERCSAADGQHLASLGAGIPRLSVSSFPQCLPPSRAPGEHGAAASRQRGTALPALLQSTAALGVFL